MQESWSYIELVFSLVDNKAWQESWYIILVFSVPAKLVFSLSVELAVQLARGLVVQLVFSLSVELVAHWQWSW